MPVKKGTKKKANITFFGALFLCSTVSEWKEMNLTVPENVNETSQTLSALWASSLPSTSLRFWQLETDVAVVSFHAVLQASITLNTATSNWAGSLTSHPKHCSLASSPQNSCSSSSHPTRAVAHYKSKPAVHDCKWVRIPLVSPGRADAAARRPAR